MAKNSSWPVTGLWSRGPLKDLKDSKLILNESKLFPWSSRISLVPFRIFRGTLFSKPITGQELFFAVSYSKPALVKYIMKIWIQYSDLKSKIEVVVQYQIVMFVQFIFLIRWLKINVHSLLYIITILAICLLLGKHIKY